LDKKGYAGAMLMDLSKAFDTINHNLLIAKLHAYGLSRSALKLIKSYLSNRWQRTKINTSFSSWTELKLGVPQGSVLGPILFNIYLNDLFWFFEFTNACNFADDTTLHACNIELKSLLQNIEHDTMVAIEWLESNNMKANGSKFHLLVAGNKNECTWAKVGESIIYESYSAKLLGTQIDRDLRFKYHIMNLCKKAGRKLSALVRLCRYYTLSQRRLTLKSFIESQFSYSPLAWMFHDRGLNNKINRIHERALRIVYRDDISTFDDLLKKDNSFCIHHRNIHALAIELYKAKNKVGTEIMGQVFITKNDRNIRQLRSQNDFFIPQVNSVHFGHDSLRYFGPKLWEIIPNDVKDSLTIEEFKLRIKKWTPIECPCRLCKIYIGECGYVDIFE